MVYYFYKYWTVAIHELWRSSGVPMDSKRQWRETARCWILKSSIKNTKAYSKKLLLYKAQYYALAFQNTDTLVNYTGLSLLVFLPFLFFSTETRGVWKFFILNRGHWAQKADRQSTRRDRHNSLGQIPLLHSDDAVFLHTDLNYV